jgi:hypothetical protein
MSKCGNCGATLAEEQRYCQTCGTPAEPESGNRRWVALAIIAAVVVVAAGVFVLLPGGDDTATAGPEDLARTVTSETITTADGPETEDTSPATTTTAPSTTAPAATTTTTTTTAPDPGTSTTLASTITLPASEIVAAASSYLANDSDPDRYAPSQMLDGDLATAWNHCGTGCPDLIGDARQGVGVLLSFQFDEPVELVAIRIANGYQKISATVGDVWPKNNRVASLDLESEGGSMSIVLSDERGYQVIPTPLGITAWVEMSVTRVYYGDGTYNDLAISEIEFVVRRVAVGA